jgi:hypothetical protein
MPPSLSGDAPECGDAVCLKVWVTEMMRDIGTSLPREPWSQESALLWAALSMEIWQCKSDCR